MEAGSDNFVTIENKIKEHTRFGYAYKMRANRREWNNNNVNTVSRSFATKLYFKTKSTNNLINSWIKIRMKVVVVVVVVVT